MKSAVRDMVLIGLVAATVLFTNLGGPRLWDRDEPRNAGCTAEMLARGDLVTPVFDAELRTHKPILLYWFMMAAFTLFGINEFAARFWSAALAVGTAWLTYGMGRRLFSPQVGRWAAIALVTTLMFDVAARAATPDSLLIFWSAAAIYAYVVGTFPSRSGEQAYAEPIRLFPRWPVAVVMYAMMGLAVLAKGPVGLVLPTAVIGMYLLIWQLKPSRSTKDTKLRFHQVLINILRPFAPMHFLRTCWLMRPITALAVVAIVALPWYIAVGIRTDGEWIRGFLLDHNLGRATQSLEGHEGSFLFYPLALLVGFFPWSVFAVPTVLEVLGHLRSGRKRSAGYILAACWIGVYVVLFSIAKTKLPSYVTPCYPAIALLVAGFVVSWSRGRTFSASFWPRAALLVLGFVGLAMAVAVPLVTRRYLPGEEWLALLGCIPMLTAIAGIGFMRTGTPQRAALSFAVGAIALTTALFALGAARVDRHQTIDSLLAAAFDRCDNPRIGTLGALEPSWIFYARRPMDHLFAPELTPGVAPDTPMLGAPHANALQPKPLLNVWRFLDEDSRRFVITTASQLEQISTLPPGVEVVTRTPYFLRDDELVLLTKRANIARTSSSSSPTQR